jgi:hypothetical protein
LAEPITTLAAPLVATADWLAIPVVAAGVSVAPATAVVVVGVTVAADEEHAAKNRARPAARPIIEVLFAVERI